MADNLLSDQIAVAYGFNDLDAIAVSVGVVFGANEHGGNDKGRCTPCQALYYMEALHGRFDKTHVIGFCNPLISKTEKIRRLKTQGKMSELKL